MIEKQEIDFYLSKVGQIYDKNKKEDRDANVRIKTNLHASMINASREAAQRLFGEQNYEVTPRTVKNAFPPTRKDKMKFSDYLATRISPKNKYSPIVQYWLVIDGKTGDTTIGFGLKDNKKTEALEIKASDIRNKTKTNLKSTLNVINSIDDKALAEWIVNSIEKFEINYGDFCIELQPQLDEALAKLSVNQEIIEKKKNEPGIWKMSHGKEKNISDNNHEWFMNNGYIALGHKPDDSQFKKFNEMREGDFFYLVRNSKVVLLGQIDTQEITSTPDHLNLPAWKMRKFIKIKDTVKDLYSTQVQGKQGWKPQSNSTINQVEKNEFAEFEETILKPAFDISLRDLFENEVINNDCNQENKSENSNILNRILYGPPGTGKTFNTINEALKIVDPSFELEGKTRKELKSRFDELINEGQIVFTTFHQSMSYEDFIEGIKPEISHGSDTENDNVKYEIKPGIFKKICESAKTPNQFGFETAYKNLQKELRELKDKDSEPLTLKTAKGKDFSIALNSQGNLTLFTSQGRNQQGSITKENIQKYINHGEGWWESYVKGILNYLKTKHQYSEKDDAPQKNYVLIIDEINRGNVSQIFGELITLIEDDKRLGMLEALEVTLPYSKERFGVPKNLYIIGTMNTADRSVEALDAALRRRFSFIEKAPEAEIIIREGFNGGEIAGVQLSEVLKTINKRLEKLLDKDHQIGHCFFLGIDNEEKLAKTFNNKIVPLLREYFFGDYGKIGLVLGSGFIQKTKDADKEPWAIFDYDASDYDNKDSYKIIDINSANILAAIESLVPKKQENGEE